MAYIPKSDSVVGFQSDASKLKVEATQPAGSVMAVSGTLTPPINQSVSGALFISGSVLSQQTGTRITSISGIPEASVHGQVGASIIGLTPVQLNIGTSPVSASNPVAIMPPTSGFLNVQVTNSVLTTVQSSVYGTVGISGSVAAVQSGTSATSISGVVNVAGSVFAFLGSSIYGNISGSVIAQIASSVLTVISGNVPTTQIAGSVMAVSGSFTAPANQSVSGTVVATQLAGSVMAVSATVTPAANQSVSGTVGASVIGHAPVVIVGGSILTSSTANQSVSGTVDVSVIGLVPIRGSVSGTVGTSMVGGLYRSNTGFQASVHSGIPQWGVRNEGNVDFSGNDGDYIPIAVNAKGRVFVSEGNHSVSGALFISGSVLSQQTGTVITSISGVVNIAGSVISQIASSVLVTMISRPSISGAVFVSGSVLAQQTGTVISSVVNSIPSSMLVGASAFGVFPVVQSGAWTHSVVGTVGASIIGTVPVVQSGTFITSIVGTLATTASVFQVLSSISTVSILALNAARKGATIYNLAETDLFVKLGTGATTSVFTVLMNNKDYYELPAGYTGVVAGITASTTGKTINVTELT